MKNYLLLLFFCSLSLFSKSQVVTGVYKGKMVSDSLKYSVDFELTLKEKNGELYGYCQRLFLIEDVLYYNLVKVKARIKDSVLIVEDEKSVSNNFEQKTKGIKTVYMFNIKDIVDTASVLNGEWNTSSWRNLYAIPGKLIVNRERNYLATQLYKRLEEKKLSKDMLFDEPKPVLVSTPTKPQPTDVAVNTPTTNPSTQNKPEGKTSKDTVVTTTVAVAKPEELKPKPTDVAVNQTTTPVQNKPVVTAKKDSSSKISVAANNPQQTTAKPNDAGANQPNNKPPVSTQTQNQPIVTNTNKPTTTSGNNTVTTQQQNKPVVIKPVDTTTKTSVAVNNPQQSKPQPTTAATNPKQNQSTANTNKTSTTTSNPVVTTQQQTKPQQNTTTATNKPVEQKPTPAVVTSPATTTPQTQNSIASIGNVTTTSTTGQPQAVTGKPPVINNPVIVKRQVEIIEALEVTEDSVVLSLYDNGEIDGDTVSVFLNNELIVSRIGIKASAYKKTIAVPKGEIIQLTLFAENLGSIPPNTGLLIVTTTNERYQVNFSSTLNKSSSIVLKRKE
ncbi:MAG TPA: hypothetical protein VK173_10190 [Lacibacter sp.]|nr:hypothetical protein [Lacibacter sp.]